MPQITNATNAKTPRTVPNLEAVMAENARLQAQVAELLARKQVKVSCKISEKGACSVYGLGRWPLTLYAGQWRSLFEHEAMIKKFLTDNAGKLKEKE